MSHPPRHHATASSRPFPGSMLLHPGMLLAVGVLVLNDHVFKARWPSWWTGKLSDVAGLVMFPLLLQALWEVARAGVKGEFHPSRHVLWGCILAAGLGFSATKVSRLAAEGWRWGLGGMQWPVRAVRAWGVGQPWPSVRPVSHVMDVTDLLALPALGLAWRLGRGRCAPLSSAGDVVHPLLKAAEERG
ncbi:hypothetical protein DRW03_14610 [Corallococcus sp. H22C18031201]|nr:hypothetical protein DRW03_14610 [Corallococcus sp. H22C18031201]